MVQATINRIRRSSRKTSRKPSQLEPRSSDGAPIEKGMRRIEAESAADARNEAEFMAKAAPIPTKAKMAPPSAGPTSLPTLEAADIRPFAHPSSPSPTRLGTAALAARPYGNPRTDPTNAIAMTAPGSRIQINAHQQAAEPRSDAIITRRLS